MRFPFVSELSDELKSVMGGYPDFVLSNGTTSRIDHVPVFCYHSIDAEAFERDLRFLDANGYRTLGMNELVAYLGGKPLDGRGVVLSFDDARSSFWRFAFPLLKRHGMKGVLFVIAGLTPDADGCRPNLDAVGEGTRSLSQIVAIDPRDDTLCTWPELQAMYASGHVEIESHSLFHREVFVGTRLVDFIGPDTGFVPFDTPVTAYLGPGDVGRDIVPEELFGLPLFEAAPLHKALPSLELTAGLREFAAGEWARLTAAERESGEWRRILRERWKRVDLASGMRRLSAAEVEAGIEHDLATARDLLRRNVSPACGNHFCLPFSAGSELTVEVASRLGIRSCSWGTLEGRRHNGTGDDAMRVLRVKSDFLWRLPGAGRNSLVNIYGRKILRRLSGERVY